jgi:hypothetical protein
MDPILNLADFSRSVAFRSGCTPWRVIPQIMQAGSRALHPRFFYVECEATNGIHQIDASRLACVMADGGTGRRFSASEVARMLPRLFRDADPLAMLNAIKIQS